MKRDSGSKGGKAAVKPLRFSLDRRSGRPYVQQLTDALRSAIECGYYRDGDILPSLEALAATANVSLIVPREAITRLAESGLVIPCRGVGCVARAPKMGRLGHVLLITSEIVDNRFIGAICGTLRRELVLAGCRVSQVSVVLDPYGKPDFSQLDALLDTPVSLAVSLSIRYGIGRHVASSGVPTIVTDGDASCGKKLKNVVGRLPLDRFTPLPEFVAHCVRAGVRHVTVVTIEDEPPVALAALRAAGVPADELRCPIIHRRTEGERSEAMRQVFDAIRIYCRRRHGNVRDLFFFSDDFAARGALTAFLAEGVRIPEDVQVVTWCVWGDEPLSVVPLTRLESNPFVVGHAYAKGILALLNGSPATFSVVGNRYVVGKSFPA